jgi:hypothetical protein
LDVFEYIHAKRECVHAIEKGNVDSG